LAYSVHYNYPLRLSVFTVKSNSQGEIDVAPKFFYSSRSHQLIFRKAARMAWRRNLPLSFIVGNSWGASHILGAIGVNAAGRLKSRPLERIRQVMKIGT
jgi:hypothetical protein